MKSLFIIPTHAPNIAKQNLLLKCIDALKAAESNFDIMITSHTPLPENIISKVEYYIYDNDNRFSNASGSIFWTYVQDFTVLRFGKYSHEYPIIRLVRNSIHLAKANEYKFFFSTDFDNIYSVEDIKKFIELKDRMMAANKEFIFFNPPNAVWVVDHIPLYGIYYDLTNFGGSVDKFLELFDNYFPKTLEEYNKKLGHIKPGRPQCLEHYFYDAFKSAKHNTLVLDQYVKEFVNNSELNKSGLANVQSMILPGEDGKYYLYMINFNTEPYVFNLRIDGQQIESYELYSQNNEKSRNTSGKLIELNKSCDINVEVFKDGVYVDEHQMTFDINDTKKYKDLGIIKFSIYVP